MAVTTTPQDILEAAYATSSKNQPGLIADEPSELLAVVNRKLKAIYTLSIGVDPTYFGVSSALTEASATWPEPEDAGAIFYLEQLSDSAEVVIVPVEEKDAEDEKLSVYSLGRTLIGAGVNDPASTLTAYYTKEAEEAADLVSALDQTWDEAHNEFLIAEVALFLAVKDGREEEYAGLELDRNLTLNRFLAKLERHYANVRSRFGPRKEIIAQSLVAPTDLLAG